MMRTMLLTVAVAAAVLAGCDALPRRGAGDSAAPGRPQAATSQPSARSAQDPLAYIDGQVLTAQAMRQPLMEAAGGQVLSEVVLDRLIQARLRDAGQELTPALIERERALLIDAVTPGPPPTAAAADAAADAADEGAAADEDRRALLLRELRRRRGLGEVRFARLLRRNAGLRLLVQGDVEVTPQAVRQAYQLVYGPAYRARILVVPTADGANRLRTQLIEGEATFPDLAVSHSTDPSAVQGGLLPPISPVDPAYPKLIRDTLSDLDHAGQALSEVLAMGGGYALLRLERKTQPQAVEFADVEDQLARQVRRQTERVLMQRLARELLAEADVVVLDPALSHSWRQQKDALLGE